MIKLVAFGIIMVVFLIAMNSGTDDAYMRPAPEEDE